MKKVLLWSIIFILTSSNYALCITEERVPATNPEPISFENFLEVLEEVKKVAKNSLINNEKREVYLEKMQHIIDIKLSEKKWDELEEESDMNFCFLAMGEVERIKILEGSSLNEKRAFWALKKFLDKTRERRNRQE